MSRISAGPAVAEARAMLTPSMSVRALMICTIAIRDWT
jgi:hypothetical protein